jgi:hypothetical protein
MIEISTHPTPLAAHDDLGELLQHRDRCQRSTICLRIINPCDERPAFSSDGVGRRTVPAANVRIVNMPSYYDSEGVVA